MANRTKLGLAIAVILRRRVILASQTFTDNSYHSPWYNTLYHSPHPPRPLSPLGLETFHLSLLNSYVHPSAKQKMNLAYSRTFSGLLLMILAGDIELNPGPAYRFPCVKCNKPVRSNQKGLQCDSCDRWCHAACEQISEETYYSYAGSTDDWVCSHCCLPPLTDSFFNTNMGEDNSDNSPTLNHSPPHQNGRPSSRGSLKQSPILPS